MKTQRQTFRNNTAREIEVYVEAYPQRYVLRPGDEMVVEAEVPADYGEAFSVNVTERGLQIYPAIGVPERVFINGELADENWEGSS